MVIVMNMVTGRNIADEFGVFEEEVMNAEWQPMLQLDLQASVRSAAPRTMPASDAEAFLRSVYLSQE